MTQSAFTPTTATAPTPVINRLAPTRGLAANLGRVFRHAAAALGKALGILVAYRAALKRLEAGVKGDLFDEPVLWAEIKSTAWAEAVVIGDHWEDQPSARSRSDWAVFWRILPPLCRRSRWKKAKSRLGFDLGRTRGPTDALVTTVRLAIGFPPNPRGDG